MRIVLDIETEPFSEEFRQSKSTTERLKLAPRPRLACVFVEKTKKYRFFLADQFRELVSRLSKATEIITYNGVQFDFLVIKKHLGIKGKLFSKAKSVDLLKIMKDRAGFKVSLDAAAKLNLNERKKFKGAKLGTAPIKILKAGCRSDVRQTYQLWKRYRAGTLKVPRKSEKSYWERYDDYSETSVEKCSRCGATTLLHPDVFENMSEGQQAEYIAWTLGGGFCPFCEGPAS